MAEDRGGGLGEGIRNGIGILNALKEALEETLNEAISRGEVSPERAKSLMKDAADRVQSTFGEARERMDVASRREVESLRSELAELKLRVEDLESRAAGVKGIIPSPGGPDTPAPGV